MKKILAAILALIITIPAGTIFAEEDIAIFYNGTQIVFNEKKCIAFRRIDIFSLLNCLMYNHSTLTYHYVFDIFQSLKFFLS